MGMREFNSDNHYIYYCGHESHRRSGVTRVWNEVLGCNLKNDRMILVCFQGKPFHFIVIQVYSWTTDAEEGDQFYEDLRAFLITQFIKNPPAMQETLVWHLGQDDPLDRG